MYLLSYKKGSNSFSKKYSESGNKDSEYLQITSEDVLNEQISYFNEDQYSNSLNDLESSSSYPYNDPPIADNKTKTRSQSKNSNVLLNEMSIELLVSEDKDNKMSMKIDCQLWTSGFDRSFKV